MKKMLDELKKLDATYDVPQDFSKKVMKKIKSESALNVAAAATSKNSKGKMSHIMKYVIPCTSVAAAILVAVVYKGMTPSKDLALESIQVATLRKESNGAYMEGSSMLGTNDVVYDYSSDTDNGEAFEMPSSANSIGKAIVTSNFAIPSNDAFDASNFVVDSSQSNNLTSEKREATLMQELSPMDYFESDVEKVLKEFNIQYDIIGDEILVKNSTKEEIEECLKEHLDGVEITEDESIIRIKLK